MLQNNNRTTLFLCSLAVAVISMAGMAQAQKFKLLYSFQGGSQGDGQNPYAGLIADQNGNLYGTTALGGVGTGCCGTVFQLSSDGSETVLYAFGLNGKHGERPYGGLLLDASGNLYGTTLNGGNRYTSGGTVFELSPDGSETVLHKFVNADYPTAGLVSDSAGNLYSTTLYGGKNFYGSVFKVAPDGQMKAFYSFCELTNCADGKFPHDGLIFDKRGNLYGTTYRGGANGDGTVFKLSPGGAETVLYSFGSTGASFPNAGVIRDKSDNLYGTTESDGDGTVFKLAADRSLTILHSFSGSDGATPEGGVIRDKAGSLYGTVSAGGDYGMGAVYKLAPDGTFALLHSFNGTDGETPEDSLIMDGEGNLFGTTYYGGASSNGTVFEIKN